MKAMIRQFPLAAGLAEGSDPKLLPPGTLLSLLNGVWRKEGRVDKRFGTEGLTKEIDGGGTLSAGKRLVVRGRELALIDGTAIYSYAPSRGKFVRIDQAPDVGLEWSTLNDTHRGIASLDLAYTSGYRVHAWVTGDPTRPTDNNGPSFVQVMDESGATVFSARLGTTSRRIRVLVIGTTAIFVYLEGTEIVARTLALSTMTLSGQTTLRNDPDSTYYVFDACVIGSTFVVAYENTTLDLKLYSYDTALANLASGGITGEAGFGHRAIAIDGAAGEVLYVVYSVDSTVKTRIAIANPSTLAQTVAPVDLHAETSCLVSVRRYDASNAIVAYTLSKSAATAYTTTSWKVSSAAVVDANSQRGTWGVRLVTRPFLLGSRAFAVVTDLLDDGSRSPFTGQNTYLVELETSSIGSAGANVPHRYLGRIDVNIGGQTVDGSLPNVPAVSATKAYAPVPFLATVSPSRQFWRCGARLVTITTGADLPADFWRSVNVGEEAYVSAGLFHTYDGATLFDYGFATTPSLDAITPSGGAITGDYVWAVVQEYRSAAGMLYRSPIGTVSTPTNLAAQRATLQIAVGGLTLKLDLATGFGAELRSVLAAVFRNTNAGEELYRLTIEPSFNVTTVNPQSHYQSHVDNRTDLNIDGFGTDLNTRTPPYTSGGVVDDIQPPASLTQCLHRGRLFSLSGDGKSVWFSKRFDDDLGVAPGFNDTFYVPFNERVIALASMDEKLVILSDRRPFYVLGEGPAANGEGAYEPIPIQADVGCANPRSVVSTPAGIMFESSRGLTLLTRGLEVVYLGQPVEDTLEAFPRITSAVLVPDQNQVRWTCNNDAGTAGRTIVFDYATKQWAVFSHFDADAGVSGTPIADAVLWNGVWTFVTPAGKVYREDATTHLDNRASFVKQSGQIAWISEGGPLGFQHIRRAFVLGDRYTDVDFTLRFAFNHKAGFQQSYTWVSDKFAQFGDGANVGLRVGCQNGASPRCRAFSVAWEDAAPTGPGAVLGTGQGFNLSAIGLEFLPKPEMDRRSARARA